MTDRIKFAYLTYGDMLSKLESGEINEYDINNNAIIITSFKKNVLFCVKNVNYIEIAPIICYNSNIANY